jgi:hypothetical protein
MLAVMSAALLESPAMPRKPEKPAGPDDLVRYTGVMTRTDRARLKSFCARTMQDMETTGVRWILERLAEEERKLGKR